MILLRGKQFQQGEKGKYFVIPRKTDLIIKENILVIIKMDISTLKNNSYCSERVSPRRLRANKILPPECHHVLQSYCTQRISPRRQRNDCEEFVEDVLLSNVKTSLTDPSSPILDPSSFPSQIIQKEETPEIQEVFDDQRVSASQEVSASQGVYVSQSNDQSSSENISESSQDESPEPSSSSTKIKNEDPLKSPLPSRDRVDYAKVLNRMIFDFGIDMLKIVNIEPHVPQRNIAIDIYDITNGFAYIIENGRFDKDTQEYLLERLDHLADSTTEVLRKNIDIKEIKQKTIKTYEDAARLVQKIIESDPRHHAIRTTGNLQAVLNKAHQLSNDLKKVPRNVVPTQTTSTGSRIVSVADDTDATEETSGTTAEDIEKMIEAIFNAFNILVDRSQNKNE